MSQPDEPWVRAAMSDDHIVADLLVRLHGSAHQPPPSTTTTVKPLNWTVRRQRGSRPPQHDSSKKSPNHHHQLRGSPTTALSWSTGSSQDGSDESTRNHGHVTIVSDLARSKVNEDSEKAVSKKSRKRKTLAELKDEENSLVKERRELKREIAALRLNLEKQWATNENLKRMKNELQRLPASKVTSGADASISQPLVISEIDVSLRQSSSHPFPKKNADSASCKKFVIPDLNIPFEEDSSAEVLCGVS